MFIALSQTTPQLRGLFRGQVYQVRHNNSRIFQDAAAHLYIDTYMGVTNNNIVLLGENLWC